LQSITKGGLTFPKGEEKKSTVGTIIIASKGTITLQDVTITNLTDINLELWVKLNEKIKEIAVRKID